MLPQDGGRGEGADLAFFEWTKLSNFPDIQSVYGVLDSRTGQWLRVKTVRER